METSRLTLLKQWSTEHIRVFAHAVVCFYGMVWREGWKNERQHGVLFISVFNQLDAQNLCYNKFYFMPLHVSSTCAHHQEVKIALHSLWYHHTCRHEIKLIVKQILCIKLVKYWDKYTEMHGQQNVKKKVFYIQCIINLYTQGHNIV